MEMVIGSTGVRGLFVWEGVIFCEDSVLALEILVELDAPRRATEIEGQVRRRFSQRVRGRGAMLGVQMDNPGAAAVITGQLLRQGYIVLPGGVDGDILALTPPLVVTDEQLGASMDAIENLIAGG